MTARPFTVLAPPSSSIPSACAAVTLDPSSSIPGWPLAAPGWVVPSIVMGTVAAGRGVEGRMTGWPVESASWKEMEFAGPSLPV